MMTDSGAEKWIATIKDIKQGDSSPQWSFQNFPTFEERMNWPNPLVEPPKESSISSSFTSTQDLYLMRYCYYGKNRKTTFSKKVAICLGSMIAYINPDTELMIGTVIQQSKNTAQVIPWKKIGQKYEYHSNSETKVVPRDSIVACGYLLNANGTLCARDKEKIQEILSSIEVPPPTLSSHSQSQTQPQSLCEIPTYHPEDTNEEEKEEENSEEDQDSEEDGYDEGFEEFEQ